MYKDPLIEIIICCWCIFLGLMAGYYTGEKESYQQAYVDMQERKIDLNVMKRFPDLWIKYHMPEEYKK